MSDPAKQTAVPLVTAMFAFLTRAEEKVYLDQTAESQLPSGPLGSRTLRDRSPLGPGFWVIEAHWGPELWLMEAHWGPGLWVMA